MAWHELASVSELDSIVRASEDRPQLIFKHSTRCPISAGAKYRMDNSLRNLEAAFDCHFLDLIAHRDISNAIADRFEVIHESPQVLIIEHGESSFDISHSTIREDIILNWLSTHHGKG